MRVLAVVGLVLFVSLLVQPAVSQVPDDKLIVPGQRIGKWTLNLTIADLLKMNGPRKGSSLERIPDLSQPTGDDVPADSDLWVHRWWDRRLLAVTVGRESQVVVELAMFLSEYKTDKGIGVGSSKEAVQRAYGPPTAVAKPRPRWWSGIYDKIGLMVAFGPDNTAQYVSVFRPGTAKRLYKFSKD